MQNSRNSQLVQQSVQLIESINDSITWADKNLRDIEKTTIVSNLKFQRRTISKTKDALQGKPVLALFGASQVGKSYMANNLLYNKNNQLLIHDHTSEEEIDFIKNINPEGKGNEATSTVTRFTADRIKDINKKPVKIKLFTIKDIILIIADGYFSDFIDNSDRPNAEEISAHLQSISNYQVNDKQFYFSDDDVFEIKEYLVKHYSKLINELLFSLNISKFWDNVADIIQNIPVHKIVDVFSILWNFHQPINDMLNLGIRELEKLEFSKEAYVDFSAIHRDSTEESGNAIINVKTLSNFFENDTITKTQLNSNEIIEIATSKLCFLTSEIVLSVSKTSIENRPFIEKTDIIDFPGARSREELRDLSDQSRIYMLLRGKVSYLFNYYSSNYLTNTLFVCMRTQQTNVTSMPRLIKQWIHDNIGETEAERGIKLGDMSPPLFVIFTWWNTQLQYKEKTDNMNPLERIQKQFETRFQQEIIGTYDWHQNWSIHDNKKTKFRNFYFLRDFKESELIYKSTDGKETSFFSEPQENFYGIYRNELINYHKQNPIFFEDPELSFDEASQMNKDGSEYIIRNLTKIPFEENFINFHNKRLKDSFQSVLKTLNKFYHDEHNNKQYLQAIQDAASIHMILNRIFGIDSYFFGKLMELLLVTEKEIFEMNHDALRDVKLVDNSKLNEMFFYKIHSPRLILGEENNSEENYKINLKILCEDYKRESLDDTEMFFTQRGINLTQLFFGKNSAVNKSDALAEKATQYWFNKILIPERFSELTNLGFDTSLLEKLLQNIKNNYTKNQIERKIAGQIKDYVDLGKRLDEAEDLVAHVTASIINDFVNYLGWKTYSEKDINHLKVANQTYKLGLKIPEGELSSTSVHEGIDDGISNVEDVINMMENLNDSLNSTKIDENIVNKIPMFKFYNNWINLMKISFIETCDIPNYDVYANRQLGECISKLEHNSIN